MNHNEFKQMIQLSLYGELSDNQQKLLITHLESCEECRTELKQQKKIMMLIADHKNVEVNEDLLKEARLQLRGALRQERNSADSFNSFANYILKLFSTPPRLAFGAVSFLILGIIIGSIFIGREKPIASDNNTEFTHASIFENDLRISNMQFIDSDPSDGEIDFTFDAVKKVRFKGDVNDPKVQSVLTYAMLNDQNPGSRFNSINVMESYGKVALDKDIKDALVTVAMTDNNQGVRREALKLLNRSALDESIKQANLFVLLNDSSSALRIEALNALIEAARSGHSLNQKDLDLVIKQAGQDDNNYIKLKSKTLLQEYN
ncbi:MAG: zf-HC2 domain-containing protein [Ignavibacteriaceae bacterium]